MQVTAVLFCLFATLALGMPVGFSMGLSGIFGLYMVGGLNTVMGILDTTALSSVSSYELITIPMFLLMGYFAMHAGIGDDLYDACTKWLGRLPGGLAVATTGAAAAFGAASGSSVGSAMLFTKLALPEMVARGYDKSFASACIAIAGTLAVLIPPSALMVVYGILTNSSIGELLIGGIIPGLVFATILGVFIIITSISFVDGVT